MCVPINLIYGVLMARASLSVPSSTLSSPPPPSFSSEEGMSGEGMTNLLNRSLQEGGLGGGGGGGGGEGGIYSMEEFSVLVINPLKRNLMGAYIHAQGMPWRRTRIYKGAHVSSSS
jgi:hypothetical protein